MRPSSTSTASRMSGTRLQLPVVADQPGVAVDDHHAGVLGAPDEHAQRAAIARLAGGLERDAGGVSAGVTSGGSGSSATWRPAGRLARGAVAALAPPAGDGPPRRTRAGRAAQEAQRQAALRMRTSCDIRPDSVAHEHGRSDRGRDRPGGCGPLPSELNGAGQAAGYRGLAVAISARSRAGAWDRARAPRQAARVV